MRSPHDGAEALSGNDVPPLGVVNGETLVRRALTMTAAAAAHPSPSHSPDRSVSIDRPEQRETRTSDRSCD